MQLECLPFNRIPHTTPLFDAFLYDFPRVRPFFAQPPLTTNWFANQRRSIKYDDQRRLRVAETLKRQNFKYGSSPKALQNIERLGGGACAVVTGQQVGLFGGPLFAVLKALTAVRIAEDATRLGVDSVPVFWLATEDHDLAEVDQVVLPGAEGSLEALSTSVQAAEGAPVGNVRFAAEVESIVARASNLLGGADVVEALRAIYHEGASFGDAFGKLFARVFADFGVVLLDANDPELHRVAGGVYADAIRHAADLDTALLARGEALRHAGFHEQVKVTSSSALLFAVQAGVRTVIHRANGGFAIGKDKEKLSEKELLDRIAAAPEQFSPNVLLRPVVQDYLLPTLAYVGGPAEVAYFAQAAVVYERLLGYITPVWPRLSVSLVEPHAKRLLDRYHLKVTDVFQDNAKLRALLAGRTFPADLQHNFDAATNSLNVSLDAITESLRRLDPTLVDAAKHAGAKMQYQLGRLRTRAAGAEIRRNEVLSRHAAVLSASLFPHGTLQERVIGGVYFLARYPDLLQTLYEVSSLTCPDHQVVYL